MIEPDNGPEAFMPRGAIAFFAVLIACYAGFWFAMYALLIRRG